MSELKCKHFLSSCTVTSLPHLILRTPAQPRYLIRPLDGYLLLERSFNYDSNNTNTILYTQHLIFLSLKWSLREPNQLYTVYFVTTLQQQFIPASHGNK